MIYINTVVFNKKGLHAMRKFFLFMDTITNKVDNKGRVSLPADYREIVKELSTEIVCYRSLTATCIE